MFNPTKAARFFVAFAAISGLAVFFGQMRYASAPQLQMIRRSLWAVMPGFGLAAACQLLPGDGSSRETRRTGASTGDKTTSKSAKEAYAERLRLACPRYDDLPLEAGGKGMQRQVDKQAVDRLLDAHAPFSCLEETFGEKIPKLDVAMRHCGKGLKGEQQLALVLALLREISSEADTPEAAQLKEQVEWPYAVGKLLANCEPPDGLLVPHPSGYYRVLCSLNSKGAYAILLKPVTTGDLRPLVVYRGTRARVRATQGGWSLYDDLTRHIGATGMQGLASELHAFLEDPDLDFVGQGKQHDVIGMSLGGAQAEAHAFIFSALGNLVRRATMVCPAGVTDSTIAAFQALNPAIHLVYVTERDDCTPETGEGHIGLGCSGERLHIDYYMLEVAQVEGEASLTAGELPDRPPVAQYLSDALGQLFIKSLPKSHIRYTFGGPHRIFHLDNRSAAGQERIDEVLAHCRPNTLEEVRQSLSHGEPTAIVDLAADLQKETSGSSEP